MVQEYNATVVDKIVLSEYLAILRVKPDFEIDSFKSGQFAVLGLLGQEKCVEQDQPCQSVLPEKMIKKAYSIASSPTQMDSLEFYIALVPGGELTPRLFRLGVGDRLFLGKKITGKFTLDQIPPDKNLLMIGTGTGLAPFISMVRTDLVCGQGRHFVIVHGARHSSDLGYFQELSLLSRNCNNFHYIPTISRPAEEPNWGGYTGRVTQTLVENIVEQETGLALTPQNFDILVCGGPDMIEDVTRLLESKGFKRDSPGQPGQIHKEEYW